MLQSVTGPATEADVRRRWGLLGSALVTAIGVFVVAFALLWPVETGFGFRVATDIEDVASDERPTVTCGVFHGQYEYADERFGEAKDEACSRATSRRWLVAGVGAALFGVLGLVLGWRGERSIHVGRVSIFRPVVMVVAALLVLSALPLGWLGWLGTNWSPAQSQLPAALARPFEENGIAVVLAFDTMDSPSVSIESAPPNTTRYILVTDATSPDEAALIERVAGALRAGGFDLRPGTEVSRQPWFAYWAPNVNVGSLDAFANDDDIGRSWDHDTVSELLRRAEARHERPVALVVTFTL